MYTAESLCTDSSRLAGRAVLSAVRQVQCTCNFPGNTKANNNPKSKREHETATVQAMVWSDRRKGAFTLPPSSPRLGTFAPRSCQIAHLKIRQEFRHVWAGRTPEQLLLALTCLRLMPASLANSARGLPTVPWMYAAPWSHRAPDLCRRVRILRGGGHLGAGQAQTGVKNEREGERASEKRWRGMNRRKKGGLYVAGR